MRIYGYADMRICGLIHKKPRNAMFCPKVGNFTQNNEFVKQICKTKKIRKTFVNLFSFCMGRFGIRSCRFSQRFKQISKHEFAISWAVRKQSNLYTNEYTARSRAAYMRLIHQKDAESRRC